MSKAKLNPATKAKAVRLCKSKGYEFGQPYPSHKELAKALVHLFGNEKTAALNIRKNAVDIITITLNGTPPVPMIAKIKKAKIKNYIANGQPSTFYYSDAWRQLRYKALVRHGGKCQCCGKSAKDGIVIHVDHIKPRSKHPELELDIDNLQILCEDCNIGKLHLDMTDWR